MRMHDYLTDDSLDFAGTDERFATLLAGADWLDDDDAYLARLGLHEVLVNIRTHAYGGAAGDIEVGATITPNGVVVALTDWGDELADVQPQPLPHDPEAGGYGLAIVDQAFGEVTYRRVLGRNHWVLTLVASA